MKRTPEADNLDELAAQFELLRDTLTRTARAIVLIEDERAARLLALARGNAPRFATELVDDAQQARLNADVATAIVMQAERMARSAQVSANQEDADQEHAERREA